MTASASPRTVVSASHASSAIGPYSQAIRHGDVLCCSGGLPLDSVDGSLVTDSPAAHDPLPGEPVEIDAVVAVSR